MKARVLLPLAALLLILGGCTDRSPRTAPAPPTARDADFTAALDQLPPEDRRLAEEQKYCAVMTENPLGSMGKPYKVMVEDQPVFLCCSGCKKKALADPQKTLATVKALKEKNAPPKK
jgi:hypothetical protein